MARGRLTVLELFYEVGKLVEDGAGDTEVTVQALHEGTYIGVEGISFDKTTGKVILYVSDGS